MLYFFYRGIKYIDKDCVYDKVKKYILPCTSTDGADRMKKKIMAGIIALGLLMAAVFCVESRETLKQTKEQWVVAIDPGHGGFDPGKVGVSGSLEKDINLAISFKVRKKLEKKGVQVVMTRTTDDAICNPEDSNKKMTDMRNRVEMINASNAAIAVSIHQNSFTDNSSKGAQVFYYTGSKDGERLAKILQTQIREKIGDNNRRMEKANSDYYVLRKANCPIVIVECGFLSNPNEEALLGEEDYQEKMAEGITEGILQFLVE